MIFYGIFYVFVYVLKCVAGIGIALLLKPVWEHNHEFTKRKFIFCSVYTYMCTPICVCINAPNKYVNTNVYSSLKPLCIPDLEILFSFAFDRT